ncbi:endo-beta-N-acetylglucosaminidase [Lacimicrobium alkaliphilum]|uniref:Cytosolic endo-beta-N-acetylglucosaminidase TIM barrel domain-containing protein n=1 Tax=Lacimicrobium alkaliphilum TaxID=1526571 RepID=A0ABQ1RL94_9ALTE|nr:endo-beta-N-acetylglucosaminidase [Lacimicrobium alkaliphilum]GGD70744.1 hypothetical protein GCM10011357_27280 [Lacimicrobium alkaliphilum]
MRASLLLYCLFFAATAVAAEIKPNEPPFALSLEQLRVWSSTSKLASADNVATVPVARRIDAPLNGEQRQLDYQARVLYAPDGMNNFANYLDTQSQFNLYNFTQWSQIHILNWFAGTADHTVQIPARPWVETAHRNGVKVIGSVFLAVARWGGNPDTAEALLEQDEQGRFIMADKLIAVAQHYNFDGWLINQETDLTAVKDANNNLLEGKTNPQRGQELAARLLAFMQYLTARAPQGMEIHWYDAMVASGEVKWQNQLNQHNSQYLQSDVPGSDGMFLNYWWNREMVQDSREQAISLGRSPYDVFTGVDLWPSRNAQRAFSRTQWLNWLFEGEQALTSVALFAPNFNFNFGGESHTPAFSDFDTNPNDEQAFYRAQFRLFAGDDLNLAVKDQQGWPGLGRHLPAKSTITSLPFITHFNTGHGKKRVVKGETQGGPWSHIGKQDLLPTWQFAVFGNPALELGYDFERVYTGGSSLRITTRQSEQPAHAPLYYTGFVLSADSELRVTYRGESSGLKVYVQTEDGQRHMLALPTAANWQTVSLSLNKQMGQKVVRVGLMLEADSPVIDANIGKLEVRP